MIEKGGRARHGFRGVGGGRKAPAWRRAHPMGPALQSQEGGGTQNAPGLTVKRWGREQGSQGAFARSLGEEGRSLNKLHVTAEHRIADGVVRYGWHESRATSGTMRVSVFQPPG